jgi:hypothetical protein
MAVDTLHRRKDLLEAITRNLPEIQKETGIPLATPDDFEELLTKNTNDQADVAFALMAVYVDGMGPGYGHDFHARYFPRMPQASQIAVVQFLLRNWQRAEWELKNRAA